MLPHGVCRLRDAGREWAECNGRERLPGAGSFSALGGLREASTPALCSRSDSSQWCLLLLKSHFEQKAGGKWILYKSILSPVKSMLYLQGIKGKKRRWDLCSRHDSISILL
jgi:hypothetical protein